MEETANVLLQVRCSACGIVSQRPQRWFIDRQHCPVCRADIADEVREALERRETAGPPAAGSTPR